MVQWTEKPAPKPQVSAPKQDEPQVVHRPVRKARKNRLTVPLQVFAVCAVFAMIGGSYFMFREAPPASPAASRQIAQERDVTTGRIVVMDDTQCRELGFDNQSGRTVQKGQVSCHDTPAYNGSGTPSLYRHPVNRLESIRRSFAQ
jgi:hypothetical protein